MIDYPRPGIKAIGFFTGYMDTLLVNDQKKMMSILCRPLPNPTSGFYLMLPESDVKFLEISVEEAMKMIVSAGAVLPGKSNEEDDE